MLTIWRAARLRPLAPPVPCRRTAGAGTLSRLTFCHFEAGGSREAALNLMDRFARALVRWRWVVLVVWAVIGAVAAVRAPATPSLLNIRGGSARETEASRTEDLLTRRFSRPIGEFFAVTFQAPASFDDPAPRAALDTPARRARPRALHPRPRLLPLHRRYHLPQPRPSRDVRDRRARGDARATARARWCCRCGRWCRRRWRAFPAARRYRAQVTGRAPLDLDVRTVVARDSARGREAAPAAHADHSGAGLRRAGGRRASAHRRGPGDRRLAGDHRRARPATRRCRCSC